MNFDAMQMGWWRVVALHKADHSMGEYQTMIRWQGHQLNALVKFGRDICKLQ
jgi:hypothetical protein